MKVAIQGGNASFHDIATRFFFKTENFTIDCNDTFREVCEKLDKGEVDYALMAIENSIAGYILPNFSLIQDYGLNIVGEYKLRIKQNLMVLPGQDITQITEIKSHYMALLQCKEYLNEYPHISIKEYHDTADAAKDIKENQLKGVAAIAGELAAERYGLEILAPSIETIKLNYTRFFVLSKKQKHYHPRAELNKSTLSFELPHQVGALAKALEIIVGNNVNLSSIHSIPIIGKPDQYTFYIDCVYDDYIKVLKCYENLSKLVVNPTILGEYKKFEIDYTGLEAYKIEK